MNIQASSPCRIFYIDSDGDLCFKHKLYYGRKLISFWSYELENIITNIEDFGGHLPYKTRMNIEEVRKLIRNKEHD